MSNNRWSNGTTQADGQNGYVDSCGWTLPGAELSVHTGLWLAAGTQRSHAEPQLGQGQLSEKP